jgi:hypothetical protein
MQVNEEKMRATILAAARQALGWDRLRIYRDGSAWMVEQLTGRGKGTRWEAIPRANEPNWWFIKTE